MFFLSPCLQSFLCLTSHTMAVQGNSSSRTCRSLVATNASIVTRLASRALTANSLQLDTHQQLGYTVHVSWMIGTDDTTGYFIAASRFFERCFDTCDDCDAFCKEVCQTPVDGVCDSIGVLKSKLRRLHRLHKLHFCHIYPIYSDEHLDKPKWEQRHLENEEFMKCSCPLSSSELVL